MNYKLYFKDDIEDIKLNEDEYVVIRNLGSGSSSSVDLIYHIEKEKIICIKTYS